MTNLKTAAVLGIVNALERNQIIDADNPLVEKVASMIVETNFDPTNPGDLQKVAVAFISLLDKVAGEVAKPDNLLDSSTTFSSEIEKARAERAAANKGIRGVGQSDMEGAGLIGALLAANKAQGANSVNNFLGGNIFSQLVEQARAQERDAVNQGRWGVGQSSMADKGLLGLTEKKSSDVDLDELIGYLQEE